MKIQAIIFDWGGTLFDSTNGMEFAESKDVINFCLNKGLRLCVASLVTGKTHTTLEKRRYQIEKSPLRDSFEFVAATDQDKDSILNEIVTRLKLPRNEILIVDDRIIRGVRYGNKNGHPTVWVKKGKFKDEMPNIDTGNPTHTIHNISELISILNSL